MTHIMHYAGPSSTCITDKDGITLWYSYETLVAFQVPGGAVVCRENAWGQTTGKHLNAIEPDKARRVDAATFARLYAEQVEGKQPAPAQLPDPALPDINAPDVWL